MNNVHEMDEILEKLSARGKEDLTFRASKTKVMQSVDMLQVKLQVASGRAALEGVNSYGLSKINAIIPNRRLQIEVLLVGTINSIDGIKESGT